MTTSLLVLQRQERQEETYGCSRLDRSAKHAVAVYELYFENRSMCLRG